MNSDKVVLGNGRSNGSTMDVLIPLEAFWVQLVGCSCPLVPGGLVGCLGSGQFGTFLRPTMVVLPVLLVQLGTEVSGGKYNGMKYG